jgi:peptide/nickel transport system substrate-binding protein
MHAQDGRQRSGRLALWPAAGDRPNRRALLAAGGTLAAGAALALTGCGGEKDNKPAPAGAAATTSAATSAPAAAATRETPRKGGTLRAAQIADLDLNTGFPFVIGARTRFLQYAVLEPLVRYRDTLQPEPLLAERFEYNADRSKLTVTLKQGVTFHNGAPVTPEDVVFGIDVMVNPAKYEIRGAFQLDGFAKAIKEMKKVDARTMEFTFDKPRPNMTDFFAQLAVTHAASFDKLRKGEDIQGTGPYRFKSWTANQMHRLEPNQSWHGTSKAGGPYLDAVEIRSFFDEDALGLAFEAGEVELAFEISGRIAKRFRDKKLTRVVGRRGMRYVGANVTNPLLKDKRVRQALFLAFDRKRFADEIEEGFAEVGVQPWPSASPAFDKALEAPMYDPAKAKDLLTQAGFSQDRPLPADFYTPEFTTAAQVVKSNLEAVGVKVDLIPSDLAAFGVKHRERKHEAFFIALFGSSELSPLSMFQLPFPLRMPNPSYYDNPDYVDIVRQLEALDPLSPQAKEQYARFNKLWLDDPWLLPLVPWHPINIVSDKLQGYSANLSGAVDFGVIWKKS